MKKKISVTIDEEVLDFLAEAMKDGRFRNRSHVVEYGLNKLLKERIETGKDNSEKELGGKDNEITLE